MELDSLTPNLPVLLTQTPELFSLQDLQDLATTLAQLETQSPATQAETLGAFYRSHHPIRDALRNLPKREINHIKPSSTHPQPQSVANFFTELRQTVKDKLKASEHEQQSPQKT